MEVRPRFLPVAAVVAAARAAQAVDGRASRVVPRVLLHEARRGHPVPGRRDGLRLDVDVLVGVDGKVGALKRLAVNY